MISIYPGDRFISFLSISNTTKTVIYPKDTFLVVARNNQRNSWIVVTPNHGVHDISTNEIVRGAIKR